MTTQQSTSHSRVRCSLGTMEISADRLWHCPACDAVHVSREHRPHTPFHACPGMGGLQTPFVPDGVRAEHRAQLREDYVGSEQVTTDGDGRPVMSIVTVRDDGQDCTVFAPAATASAEGRMA